MALGPNSEMARNRGTREELFAGLLADLSPARNKGRQRKTGEVVAGKKPFTREVAVAVEIGLHHVVRFAKQFELSLSLPAKPLGLLVVLWCPRVIKDDFVLKLLLIPGTPIHGSPTLTARLELVLQLEKTRSSHSGVNHAAFDKLILQTIENGLSLCARGRLVKRVRHLASK